MVGSVVSIESVLLALPLLPAVSKLAATQNANGR